MLCMVTLMLLASMPRTGCGQDCVCLPNLQQGVLPARLGLQTA